MQFSCRGKAASGRVGVIRGPGKIPICSRFSRSVAHALCATENRIAASLEYMKPLLYECDITTQTFYKLDGHKVGECPMSLSRVWLTKFESNYAVGTFSIFRVPNIDIKQGCPEPQTRTRRGKVSPTLKPSSDRGLLDSMRS